MNKKIAIYSAPYPGLESYCDMIDFAAEVGVNALEGFCHFELSSPDIEAAKRIRDYADKKNVTCPCFSVFADIYHEDPAEKTEWLCRFADVAKILGSPYLHHTVIGDCFDHPGVLAKKEELFESGIKLVRDVTDYAASIGIGTVYEEQGFVFNGVEGFGRFLGEVDRPVGVVADTGNVFQTGDTIADFVSAFGSRVKHAHVKDWAFFLSDPGGYLPTLDGRFACDVELGKGEIDVAGAVALLKSFGYDGYYALEFSGKTPSDPAYRASLEKLSGILG